MLRSAVAGRHLLLWSATVARSMLDGRRRFAMRTVTVQADVWPDGELRVVLPGDVTPGPHTFHIVINDAAGARPAAPAKHTLGDLLDSEFFGMWAGRTDIDDSAEYAQDLRRGA